MWQQMLTVCDFNLTDGHLALGASSLNMQCWTGTLSYFERPRDAPSAPTAVAPVGSGITDLDWIPDSDRIVACTDSGNNFVSDFSN